MKKLDKSIHKSYRPLILWADDLNEILSELRECSELSIVADNVKYDSLDEFILESKGRSPAELDIKVRDPYLTIEFSQYAARCFCSSSDVVSFGLFHKIDSILVRCERKPRQLFHYGWLMGIYGVVILIFSIKPFKSYEYVHVLADLVVLSRMFYVIFVQLKRYSLIHPVYKSDRPSFFSRNLDNIIVAVISACIGAVGGVVATKLADRFWPNNFGNVTSSMSQTNGVSKAK